MTTPKTVEDVLTAIYLAGTENGLGRQLTEKGEIMHRKEAFVKVNPACIEALEAIEDIVSEQVIGEDYSFGDRALPTEFEKKQLEGSNRLLASQRSALHKALWGDKK